MARLSYEELDELKKRYNVDTIWSWSRLNTYADSEDDGWEYMIRYIRKEKVDTTNVYTVLGTASHDTIQGYIEGSIEQEDMREQIDDAFMKTKLNGYTFPSDSVRDGYIENLRHYFSTVEYPIETMIKRIEQPVIVVLKKPNGDNVVFVGYIDLLTQDEDGKIVIVDFKSSSKGGFSGKKLQESSRQLKLYALGISQMTKKPLEEIKLRYDMQKYLNVAYLQKNGKWSKPTLQERRKWVATQEKRIRSVLMDMDYDIFEIDDMVMDAVQTNSMSKLPQEVQDRFKISQGFIDLDMTQQLGDELEEWAIKNILEIEKRSQADDLDEEFPEPRDIDTFYFNVLAPGLKKFSKRWQEQQELEESLSLGNSISSEDDEFFNSLFSS